MGTEPSLFWAPHPRRLRSLGPLCRSREQSGQPLQVEQPPHQIGFVSDLQESPPLDAPEPMPAFGLALQLFELLPRPLREPIAHRPTQPSHPLMHRLPSCRLGRNVGPDPPPDKRRQKRLGKIPLIRTHGLNPEIMLLVKASIKARPPAVSEAGPRNDSTLIPTKSRWRFSIRPFTG